MNINCEDNKRYDVLGESKFFVVFTLVLFAENGDSLTSSETITTQKKQTLECIVPVTLCK